MYSLVLKINIPGDITLSAIYGDYLGLGKQKSLNSMN